MSMTLTARFSTRRAAELAIERLVQEHGVDRNDLSVRAEGTQNTSGREISGSDDPSGPPTTEAREDAALNGAVLVSMRNADDSTRPRVEETFREFGTPVPRTDVAEPTDDADDAADGVEVGGMAADPTPSPADGARDPSGRVEDGDVPGRQSRPMTEDEKLDKSLEDTFPTSDPIAPSHIDGPNN